MSDSGRLALHVASRPMLVAGRLRAHMQTRGYAPLGPGAEAAAECVTLVIASPDRVSAWVYPDHPDSVHDDLGRLLSQELQCRVTTIAVAGAVSAYEAAEGGRTVEKLAVNGTEVLEDDRSPLAEAVAGGADLPSLLRARGLGAFDEPPDPRALVLRFVLKGQPARRSEPEIEVDPLLSCPQCGSAMRLAQSRYGPFYGCLRHPDCRGRLSVKQAESQRASRMR